MVLSEIVSQFDFTRIKVGDKAYCLPFREIVKIVDIKWEKVNVEFSKDERGEKNLGSLQQLDAETQPLMDGFQDSLNFNSFYEPLMDCCSFVIQDSNYKIFLNIPEEDIVKLSWLEQRKATLKALAFNAEFPPSFLLKEEFNVAITPDERGEKNSGGFQSLEADTQKSIDKFQNPLNFNSFYEELLTGQKVIAEELQEPFKIALIIVTGIVWNNIDSTWDYFISLGDNENYQVNESDLEQACRLGVKELKRRYLIPKKELENKYVEIDDVPF